MRAVALVRLRKLPSGGRQAQKGTPCITLLYTSVSRRQSDAERIGGFWRLEKRDDKWLLVGIDCFSLRNVAIVRR